MDTAEAITDFIKTEFHTLTVDENGKAILIANAFDGVYTFPNSTVVVRSGFIESVSDNNF